MKVKQAALKAILSAAALTAVMTGCKYDVAEPQWYKPFEAPASPTITQIQPSQATAGVNTITIVGTGFAEAPYVNGVYFDNVPAEIISASSTSITVRRPNLVADSAVVKVVPPRALTVAKQGPYKITPVVTRYGGFLSNVQLSTVAIDAQENMYVMERPSRRIVQAMPNGDHVGRSYVTRDPFDMVINPVDGKMYIAEKNRIVEVADLAVDDTAKQWIQLPSGKLVSCGDFDANGNFYTAGSKTDLVIVNHTDLSTTLSTYYAKDVILSVRVFGNYVYVIDSVTPAPAGKSTKSIYRHLITNATGTLGPAELVIDWTTTGAFAPRLPKSMAVLADGRIIVALDGPADPLVVVDPVSKTADTFYKGLLATYCKGFAYGAGTYLYMIRGDATAVQDWTTYRVDMGINSAR